ncbi:glycine-rich domain-containing protein [Brevundimonas sp.]|uniref:glycine-rich domain-containing protein n=1 Tax=Brevundimonas sp. TaxID=1871086 RepID=UPI00286C9B69|nr:hypothetical protein [Brevundimonas sp.]
MVLDGFEIIPCGGGAGGSINNGGAGGRSPRVYVTLAEMGAPATVTITVGAGGAREADGGDSSFGPWAIGHGGRANGVNTLSLGDMPIIATNQSQNSFAIEGQGGNRLNDYRHGKGSRRGDVAGGGGSTTPNLEINGNGGAVRPLSKGIGLPLAGVFAFQAGQIGDLYAGDNPNAAAGAAGHAGVGDNPGGGGNAAHNAQAGNGGFPGGGGAGSSTAGLHGLGAAGRVIIYPWFKKA